MKGFFRADLPGSHAPDRRLSIIGLLLLVTLANALVFQWPLYALAASTRSAVDLHSALALSSLFVLQLLVSISILGIASIFSVRLVKVLCAIFLVGNAAALYFFVQYGVVLDTTMIGNIVRTDLQEAAAFAHPKLAAYVIGLGVVPAVLLARARIAPSSRLKRAAFVVVVLVFGVAWLYANAQSWLWIDRNAKQFGSLMLPWSYTFNTVRFFSRQSKPQTVELLPPLTKLNESGAVVVLVIGESARAQNFSLFGYARDTNPLLSKTAVIALAGAQSCATYTTAAISCMLSARGPAGINGNDEPLPSYLYRHGVEVLWRSNNSGEPPLAVTAYERIAQLRSQCTGDCSGADFDEVLLQGLEQRLSNAPPNTKTLIVLHQSGSHGPQYYKKYPPQFEKFKPVCRSVELQNCTQQELVNAYDNTIVYNDYFLTRLIEVLTAVKTRPSALIYMSDHGESLGEHGLYLHGMPMAIAPSVQTAVPLLVWMSEQFSKARPATYAAGAGAGAGHSSRVIFHSVLGALGLTSPAYVADQDLFRPAMAAGTDKQVSDQQKRGER